MKALSPEPSAPKGQAGVGVHNLNFTPDLPLIGGYPAKFLEQEVLKV